MVEQLEVVWAWYCIYTADFEQLSQVQFSLIDEKSSNAHESNEWRQIVARQP